MYAYWIKPCTVWNKHPGHGTAELIAFYPVWALPRVKQIPTLLQGWIWKPSDTPVLCGWSICNMYGWIDCWYKEETRCRVQNEGLGYEALFLRHGGVAECRWDFPWPMEVCSRDPEEI